MFSESDILIVTNDQWLSKVDRTLRTRKVWVLVSGNASGQSEMEFLKKVLAAIQLDLDKDACLITVAAGDVLSISSLYEGAKPEKTLVFGLKPTDIGINIQLKTYIPTTYYGSSWLFSDDLSALESDKQKKGLLWAALKAMFGA